MASIRAGFVTLRTAQADAELPAELRFAPELELRLLGEEARGGVLTGGDASLALRRERTGVYCTAATGELSFQPDAGAADSELPFRLLLDKSSPWAEGVLTLDADGAPRLRLASASPAPAEGGVELELVLLVSSGGPPQAVAASVTVAPALSPLPLALPAAFLRTSSGRVSALEPIDEDVGVRPSRSSHGAAGDANVVMTRPVIRTLSANCFNQRVAGGAAASSPTSGPPALPGRPARDR